MTQRPLATLIAGFARFAAGVNVTWVGERPAPKQTIFFGNHTSHLDFVILWSSLPSDIRAQTRPVAAKDYWETGVKRALAVDVFNAILVPRHEHEKLAEGNPSDASKTIDNIVEQMGDDYSLIIFPEGTRGDGTQIARFKSGLYYLCRAKPGIQLVPAYMENLNRILPKGEFLPVPFISRVNFGSPTELGPDEPKADFLTRTHEALCALSHP